MALQTAVSTDPNHTLSDAAFILPDFDGGIALFDSQGNNLAASEQAQPWASQIQAGAAKFARLSGAVTTGQEEERRRLARDLHDDTLQSIIALNQRVQMAQLTTHDPEYAAQLHEMQTMIDQTIANLRRLTRDLRPIYLEDLGLIPALDMLTRDSSAAQKTPITFQTTGSERRITATEELSLYRMGQEALSNIARHARASCAEVMLCFAPDAITLMVRDDGIGFHVPESPAEMAATGHFGLLGIQERAELIGAHFVIESEPETGTTLTIMLPNNEC